MWCKDYDNNGTVHADWKDGTIEVKNHESDTTGGGAMMMLYRCCENYDIPYILWFNKTDHPGRCVGHRPSWRVTGDVHHWSTRLSRKWISISKKRVVNKECKISAHRSKNRRTDAVSKRIWICPKF